MKYIWRIAIVLAAAICLTAAAGAEEGIGKLPPKGARAYLELLDVAQRLYGVPGVEQTEPYAGMWQGLCQAKLVDFDGDRIPELYYAVRPAKGGFVQYLYTYQDGKALRLTIPERVSNFGSDVSPSTLMYIGADKAFLVDGWEVMSGSPVNYYTKQGNQMVSVFTYTAPGWGSGSCTANGEAVSEEMLEIKRSAVSSGMREHNVSFWAASTPSLGGTVTQVIGELRKLTNPTAAASPDRLIVDGKTADVPAYRIGGSNYYMLRSLGQALTGTKAQFEVEWNAEQNRIILTQGWSYTAVGGETGKKRPVEAAASLTSASVYLNGEPLDLTVYTIRGNNYFRLRDLGAALDFQIVWDEGRRTITVDTGKSYQTG